MDEAEKKSPSPNGKGLLRAPIVCNRWRTAGLLRLAQEADSNRDCLDILIVRWGRPPRWRSFLFYARSTAL